MPTLAYLNGKHLLDTELRLSYADAGFVYGATVTDFCRTYRLRLFRWADHLARLRRDAATCYIPIIQTDAELTAAAEQLVATHSKGLAETADLAVITFATPGPLGYLSGGTMDGPPTLGMHCFPLPKERYRRFFTEGVELEHAGMIGSDWCLVPLEVKHRSRMGWWMAGKNVEPGRVAMMVDFNGMGADTAIGAVVAVVGETLYASPELSVLDSVSLKVIEELCRELGLEILRPPSPFARLQWLGKDEELEAFRGRVTEVMLVGSAFGLAGVKRIHWPGDMLEYRWPGPVTLKLQAAWSRLVGVEIAGQFG